MQIINWFGKFVGIYVLSTDALLLLKFKVKPTFLNYLYTNNRARICKLNKYVWYKIGCFFMSSLTNFALSIPNKTKTHMITIKVAAVHFMEFPGFFN